MAWPREAARALAPGAPARLGRRADHRSGGQRRRLGNAVRRSMRKPPAPDQAGSLGIERSRAAGKCRCLAGASSSERRFSVPSIGGTGIRQERQRGPGRAPPSSSCLATGALGAGWSSGRLRGAPQCRPLLRLGAERPALAGLRGLHHVLRGRRRGLESGGRVCLLRCTGPLRRAGASRAGAWACLLRIEAMKSGSAGPGRWESRCRCAGGPPPGVGLGTPAGGDRRRGGEAVAAFQPREVT